jgi:hypothetical protein
MRIQNPKLSFGNLKLELEICLGFGIWNLGFQANHVSQGRLCWVCDSK